MNSPAVPREVFDLIGETVLVTGASSGLGRHFALTMAKAGARVIVSARRRDKLEELAAAIVDDGGQAWPLTMDVSDGASVDWAFAEASALAPVSVVINNAGLASGMSLLRMGEAEWDRILDINLRGAWLVARAAVRQMREAGRGGNIVNVASILGSTVQMGTGPYAASKAALIHLTRAMAVEWARYGVRVNALAPGYFPSEMTAEFLGSANGRRVETRVPQGRLGSPADLTGPMLLLASSASAYMTGSVLTVDGGLSLSVL